MIVNCNFKKYCHFCIDATLFQGITSVAAPTTAASAAVPVPTAATMSTWAADATAKCRWSGLAASANPRIEDGAEIIIV